MNMVRFLLGTVVFIALVLKVNATGGLARWKKAWQERREDKVWG